MSGLKRGTVYLSDQSTIPENPVADHKVLYTNSIGVFALTSTGESLRLDNYSTIVDVSGALAAQISGATTPIIRGTTSLNSIVNNTNLITINHSNIQPSGSSVFINVITPDISSVLFETSVRNRTSTSFDVLLSMIPDENGYLVDWLIIGNGILSSSSGGSTVVITSNPDLIGSGTRVITAQESIVPSTSGTLDLGSPTRPWRELYLTGNTLYIGGQALSTNNTTDLFFNGISIVREPALSNYVLGTTFNTSANFLNTRITDVDNALLSNGRVNFTIQTGIFNNPGGTHGDVVYVV